MKVDPDALKSLLLAMLGETQPCRSRPDGATWRGGMGEDRSHVATAPPGSAAGSPSSRRGEWTGLSRIQSVRRGSDPIAGRRFARSPSRRVLHDVAALLDAAAIPHAVLKGLWLAWHVYDHPALRPVRDIDIIVAKEHALAAHGTLSRAGFTPRNPHGPSPGLALASGKHLPGLMSPDPKINVEIHHRLLTPSACRARAGARYAGTLWRAAFGRMVKGGAWLCLSPTDALLHLIIHAAYEHCFCNGPLVLTDIALLLRGRGNRLAAILGRCGGGRLGKRLLPGSRDSSSTIMASSAIRWAEGNAPSASVRHEARRFDDAAG